MSLLDTIQQHLGPNEVQQISQHLGVDPTTANNAIQAALPMIVGGMAHAAQQPGGASAIQSAVESHAPADGLGGLGNIANMIRNASGSTGGGILGNILGQHTATVQNGVQTATGLDASKVASLLAILGPIVMTALAHHQATQPGDSSGGLGSILQRAATAAQQGGASSQMGGVLGQIFGKM